MTLTDIRASTQVCLTAADIAPVLGCDPHSIRIQARTRPERLGFPVIVTCRRVRIPRTPFLAYLEGTAYV